MFSLENPGGAAPYQIRARKKTLGPGFGVGFLMAKNLALTDASPAATSPEPPPELGPTGADLWCSILGEYDISDSAGLQILQLACLARECRTNERGRP